MSQARTWQAMREQIVANLERRTGEGVAAWNARIVAQRPSNEAELRTWLADQGVTGYPQMLLVHETFGYPDYLLAGADALIDGQYADRPHLRPILDAVLAIVPRLGPVEIQARKTYVTLLTPRRTFASVEPRTKSRVDLGLRLSDARPAGRLESATGMGQSGVTARIRLATPADVDDWVTGWLRQAYRDNV